MTAILIIFWENLVSAINAQLDGENFFKFAGTVVGWGYDEDGRLSEELKMLDMPIIPKEKCIYSLPEFYPRFTTLDSYCAGFINGNKKN